MSGPMPTTEAAPAAPLWETSNLEHQLEEHRIALTAHCGRLLGSSFEAEDAVQETFVRAWRAFDRFEGRASVRTWLHRIATNVCFDMRDAPQRRARPVDFASWQTPGPQPGAASSGNELARPFVGCHASRVGDDPAEQAVTGEAIHRAFVAALVHLPPRQRSVLVLREVLRWNATEVAELLGTTVASVNSTLQRARSNVADRRCAADRRQPLDEEQRPLLRHCLDAFERYDVDSLVSLLV
jgi:RNA polymerase sigma-70 factor, ECF subfamily